jgi:predicted HicB family RNase H-like nuclease
MAVTSTKKPYSLRLDEKLIKQLEKEAKAQNRSVANLIDTILMNYVNQKSRK